MAKICHAKKRNDIGFTRTVKHWRTHWNATRQNACLFDDLVIIHNSQFSIILFFAVDIGQHFADWLGVEIGACRFGGSTNLFAKAARGPAKMRFQNLSDIHS